MKLIAILVCGLVSVPCLLAADSKRAAALDRIRADIEFMAADDQQGRGVATEGIRRVADRIVAEYKNIGLTPVKPDGKWRQSFDVNLGSTGPSERTSLRFRSTRGTILDLDRNEDYQPLQRGSDGTLSGGIVFLGYGVSAPDDHYDEYAGVDVTGKTIVIIRRVPGQGDPNAPFSGESTSPHAYISTKLELAEKHKAAAVIFVNDPYTCPDTTTDELVATDGFGTRRAGIPFCQIRQDVLDKLIAENPIKTTDGQLLSSLRAVTSHLDQTLKPVSQPLSSWQVDVEVQFKRRTVQASNLIGMVEGQGPKAHETIIIGGHYDHIGFGNYGSRARNRRGEIHNGADDNASGTAAVLELARRIADGPPPKRRVLFICFSGEERGLLGSRHYVKDPLFPLKDTVFMFNFDMIGTVRNNKVEINGVGTAAEFLPLVEEADDRSPMDISIVANPFGGSDHLPFYRKDIPVMFCFTGVTDRYHTPDDDVDTINMDGIASIVDLAEQLYHTIDELPSRPEFRRSSRGRARMVVLGVRPDLSQIGETEGVRVQGVRDGSPAADAGIQVGDVIVRIGERKINGYTDLNDFLKEASDGQVVTVAVQRNGQIILIQVGLKHSPR